MSSKSGGTPRDFDGGKRRYWLTNWLTQGLQDLISAIASRSRGLLLSWVTLPYLRHLGREINPSPKWSTWCLFHRVGEEVQRDLCYNNSCRLLSSMFNLLCFLLDNIPHCCIGSTDELDPIVADVARDIFRDILCASWSRTERTKASYSDGLTPIPAKRKSCSRADNYDENAKISTKSYSNTILAT